MRRYWEDGNSEEKIRKAKPGSKAYKLRRHKGGKGKQRRRRIISIRFFSTEQVHKLTENREGGA